jgi:hypothetical protein
VKPALRQIILLPPEVRAAGATFRWQVEPASDLYLATEFTLRLPAGLDGRLVPEALWWTVALLCLHSHWTLLRPCRVLLPVVLEPGGREMWSRLIDSELATLDAYRGGPAAAPAAALSPSIDGQAGPDGLDVELVESGPRLRAPAALTEAGRCAAAFSGGKDSLLQTALLAEMGLPTVLVTTTSPMPPLADHVTARRRHVLAEIVLRRDVELAEVTSDLRACWRNDFPPRVGYPVSVNEITDTYLYTASMLVVAYLRGATHLFLASETEVQENAEIGGRTVQHTHFMYSAATQGALGALLAPLGMRYGSLISALYSSQVQQLLWTRYGDLCDLQYSCWRVAADEATCSRCSQCLRLALAALALGDTPERMGIDLERLLPAMRDWTPAKTPLGSPGGGVPLPSTVVGQRLRRQVLRSLATISTARVAAALFAGRPARLWRAGGWRAVAAYASLRRRLVLAAPGGAAELLADSYGYRAGFLRQVDPLARARLGAIFAEHFAAESPAAYAGVLERSAALAEWIAAPLAAARSAAGRDGGDRHEGYDGHNGNDEHDGHHGHDGHRGQGERRG